MCLDTPCAQQVWIGLFLGGVLPTSTCADVVALERTKPFKQQGIMRVIHLGDDERSVA